MARLIVPQSISGIRSTIDDTYPVTCTIENSYIIDGHGEYSIRVARLFNDPSSSWIVIKRFREFVEMNHSLKDYGFEFEFPKKKLFGNTDRTFMAQRQKELQAFLNALVQHIELCKSFLIQRFLTPDNYPMNYAESALQHVSMFIRSTNDNYQIIEPLFDLGWRYQKSYFLASKTGGAKDERYLLIWCHYGVDKAVKEKEISHCLKSIKSIPHPLIVPIEEAYANESGILTVYRYYPQGSLKDYIHQTTPSTGVYWKRYGPKSSPRRLDINQMKIIGRQILESLYFIYENKLLYGHLHSGNLLFNCEQTPSIQLLDIANVMTGVSPKSRYYYSTLKCVHTFEQTDTYAFGRLLYELSTSEECPTSVPTDLPPIIPRSIQEIIWKIFKPVGDLPSIRELLNEPFFQVSYSSGLGRYRSNLNSKTKEALERISQVTQERLEADRIQIRSAQRHLKLSEHLMSDEERLKRRRERQVKATERQLESNYLPLDMPIAVEIHPQPTTQHLSTATTEAIMPKKPSVSSTSLDASSTSQVSPSPPPVNDDRNPLLNSINGFNISQLKRTRTNDRSGPVMK